MNENTDIFINTHAGFNVPVKNSMYKICTQVPCDFNTDLNVYTMDDTIGHVFNMKRAYSELSNILWIKKNVQLKKYVGFCHYRAYYDFVDNPFDIEQGFENGDYDAIALYMYIKNVQAHYEFCHNKNDWNLAKEIIATNYPGLAEKFEMFCRGSQFHPRSMSIVPVDTFMKMSDFTFNVLNEFDKKRGFETDEDVIRYVSEHSADYRHVDEPCGSDLYQSRIHGYLGERLNSFILDVCCKNIKHITYKFIGESTWNSKTVEPETPQNCL